jgi:hypothetical protein
METFTGLGAPNEIRHPMKMDEYDTCIDATVFRVVFSRHDDEFYGFSVEQRGLMLKTIDPHIFALQGSGDQLVATLHPTNQPLEPALKFPCSLVELRHFLEWVGYGEPDEADLADLETATIGRTKADVILSAGSQAEAPITCEPPSGAAVPPGLAARAILAHDWPVPVGVDLKSRLADGRAKWLTPARELRGSPGKAPSLWNPAMLAICMASKSKGKTWQVDRHRLDIFIRKHFKEWVDEWERLYEYPG